MRMKSTAKSHLFVAIYFLVWASASWAQAAPGDATAAPPDLPSRAQTSDGSGHPSITQKNNRAHRMRESQRMPDKRVKTSSAG